MNKKIFPLLALSALLFACGSEGPSSGSLSSNAPLSSGEQASSETDATSSSKPSSSTLVSSATGSSSSTKPSSSGTTSSTILSSATGPSSSVKPSSSTAPSSSAKLSSSKPSSSATTPSSSAGALPPGSTFTDPRDGQIYNIVQIGTQVWFAENLNYGTYHSGATEQDNDSKVEKYCYNNNEANCDIYGGLYYWTEMMDLPFNCVLDLEADTCKAKMTPNRQGICPNGWHVPDTTDFMILIRKAQAEHPGQGNAALRDESYGSPQSPGLDSYGFAMLGSGRSGFAGPGQTSFVGGLGDTGYLWAATANPDKTAQVLEFWGTQGYFSYTFGEGGLTPDYGMPIRCIRD